jgi:ribosomal protein L7Ae-like RNA K-turn-binding protein
MHYALVISPEGQYLLTLIDHANKLVPYAIIKQTLKIGNVASMINAMVKVVLAKMSVASVTNWMGWTQTADEGMNLMQQ